METAASKSTADILADSYRTPLLRFFQRRVRPGEDADDLVQEVFSRLLQHDLAAIDSLQAYVFQTAANVLRDRARRAGVRRVVVAAPDDFDAEDLAAFSPERVIAGREAVRLMITALHELPAPVRMAFSAYHFDGVSQVDIARRFGVSLSTVEKHMAKANAHLLRRLRNVL